MGFQSDQTKYQDPNQLVKEHCWCSLEPQFMYRKRTDRVAFPLEYSLKVYQSTEQVYYYA